MSPRTLGTMVAGLTLLLVGVSTSTAAQPSKAAICHFEEGEGAWEKICIDGKAPAAHIANHDDAIPGTATSKTGTLLSASCELACGNCQTSDHGTGCEVSACQAAVCAVDSFCCTNAWDSVCAAEAASICLTGGLCAALCGDCSTTGHGAGCEFSACQAAVCAVDSFCCTTEWDGFCVNEAASICAPAGLCGGSC